MPNASLPSSPFVDPHDGIGQRPTLRAISVQRWGNSGGMQIYRQGSERAYTQDRPRVDEHLERRSVEPGHFRDRQLPSSRTEH